MRLREETEVRPKPMAPIGNQPILWRIMKYYSHFGFKDFVLCMGYRGEYIREYFINYEWMANDCVMRMNGKNKCAIESAHEPED